MSSCPSVRARNTGSGYVKESGCGDASDEAKQQLAARLAERAAQDARIWGPAPAPAPAVAKIENPTVTNLSSTRR